MVTMERIRWSLPLSVSHPAAHGGLSLALVLDGGVVCSAEPIVGRLHRGAEKLFESRDYRSALALANRHDWLGSIASEVGLATLIEQFLGIEVPPKARWLRTLVLEYTRIAHHLLWLTTTLQALESDRVDLAHERADCELGRADCELIHEAVRVGKSARGRILDLVEGYTGARMHHMVTAIGGLRVDYGPLWLDEVAGSLAEAGSAARLLREAYARDDFGLAGLAVIPNATARDFGASGPLARASGVGFDVRLDRPDDCYVQLRDCGALHRVVSSDGDAKARFLLLTEQIDVSVACVQECVVRLAEFDPSAALNVQLPRSIRLPEGQGYAETENPAGINGWYLVSRGGTHPYRLKLRTASFNNAQTLPVALTGTQIAQLPAALYSFFLVAGDTDK
jgi:NADH-quinone oxidoreductase subunit D